MARQSLWWVVLVVVLLLIPSGVEAGQVGYATRGQVTAVDDKVGVNVVASSSLATQTCESLVSEIGATETVVKLDSTITAAACTIPANITIQCQGGMIDVNDTINALTIQGPFSNCKDKQVFTDFVFNSVNLAVADIDAAWWGIDTTGVADGLVPLRAAVYAAPSGATVYAPKGTLNINQGALSICKSNFALVGAGATATTLSYNTNGVGLSIGCATPLTKIRIARLGLTSSGSPVAQDAGRGSLYFDSSVAAISDSIAEDILIDTVPTTGIRLNGTSNTVRNIHIKNVAEHGIYTGTGTDLVIENIKVENHFTFADFSVADAIKVAISQGVRIRNVEIHLVPTSAVGIECTQDAAKVDVRDVRIYFSNTNQVGFRASEDRCGFDGVHVDGGTGYANSVALDATSGATASIFRGLTTTGSFLASNVIFRAGTSDLVLEDSILSGIANTAWTVDLTSSATPTVRDVQMSSITRGINLGTSTFAQILNNRIAASVSKYDISSSPTDYVITERRGNALVAGDFVLSAGWGNTAAVSAVSGTDERWKITVTSAGTGQGANPTIQLTYKGGSQKPTPIPLVLRNGGTGTGITGFTFASSATVLTITSVGTPVADETYILVGGN